ncbi:MAG: AAA family ATPase [Candidatus Pacebacteria bacterium]|nr:AAA family ATPase [Candidatus Paceibacterota bacterium]
MTQSQTLEILKTGANVFLTGEPGSGKTHVLNEYIDWLDTAGIHVAVTASTGIAATHIGGMTIHSWSWIGARDTLSAYDLDSITSKEKVVRRVKKAQVLVIDEVSMLDGKILDMVDKITKTIRQSPEAFGGLQVIIVGDFFQLPPVTKHGEVPCFAFESGAWERARFITCYLTEQHRQEDEMLLGLLASIRSDDVQEDHYTLLSEQTEIAFPDIEPTKLFTHNKDVDTVNDAKLKELKTEAATYRMEGKGNKQVLEVLKRNCLSPEVLELRREAMVMCTKNNFEAGYVNGTLGRVVDFDYEDGFPIIETSDERRIKMMPMPWSVEEDGKVLAEVMQVPLRLAWAITVHKSQGMSLDAAEIDLRNAFTYGQGYVALSRVRTLEGMRVLGLNNNALAVNPKIVSQDEHFKVESEEAEYAFREMEDEEILKMQQDFVKTSGGTWPEEGAVPKKKGPRGTRVKKESTYEVTRGLIVEGLKVPQIAKKREMVSSTIWSHVEKLAEEGRLSREELGVLIPADVSWKAVYLELAKAMDEHGTEKLKPIFEATGEKYDYDLVRLARIMYTLNDS